MKKRYTYDLVKELLTDYPELRDSDKKLIWEVWERLSLTYWMSITDQVCITKEDFMNAPSTESIRRCRQKIQETHPELRGTEKIQRARKAIADQKGTHVYRETVIEEQISLI